MAAQPFVFEYDGYRVEYTRATVETRMEGSRLINKLLGAYGHVAGNPCTDQQYDNYHQYANAMARSRTDAPWCANSNMTEADIRERFELFCNEDEDLWHNLLLAERATQTPKKTTILSPATS